MFSSLQSTMHAKLHDSGNHNTSIELIRGCATLSKDKCDLVCIRIFAIQISTEYVQIGVPVELIRHSLFDPLMILPA